MPSKTTQGVLAVLAKKGAGGTSYYDEVIADSPVSYWRLDESSGTTVNDDITTNDMTYFNTPTLGATKLVSGTTGTAVTFASGSSEYAQIDTNIGITDYPMTIEAWFSTSTTLTAMTIAGIYYRGGTNRKQYIGLNSSGYGSCVSQNVSDSGSAAGSTVLADGNPHHLVGVFNSDTSREIFVDGVSVGTNTDSASYSSLLNGTSIARRSDSSPSNYFNGTIDEVAIYDTALSSARIQAHYDARAVPE